MSEEWRRSPSFPDYEVSNDGQVRRYRDCRSHPRGFVLKPHLSGRGYLYVTPCLYGKPKSRFIHRRVAGVSEQSGVMVRATDRGEGGGGDRMTAIDRQFACAMTGQPYSSEAIRRQREEEKLLQLRRQHRTTILSRDERRELERLEGKRR